MLTSPNKMDERMSIQSDKLSQWLSDNEVLSLALEGNIDQAQYCDRLRTLLVFLGPRLSCQDVTKIWSLRRGRAAVTVDNVHTIVTQAATKFGSKELDHLLTLIQKVDEILFETIEKYFHRIFFQSWSGEGERSKEKLVSVLGKIGLETNVSYTYEQVSVLFVAENFVRNGKNIVPIFFVLGRRIALEICSSTTENKYSVSKFMFRRTFNGRNGVGTRFAADGIYNKMFKRHKRSSLSFSRKIERKNGQFFIFQGVFVLPAMAQLHGLVESIKKSGYNAAKSQKSVISDLVNKRQLVESLCDNLIRMHKLALEMWQQKTIKMKPIVLPAMADGAVTSSTSMNNLPTVQTLSIQTPNAAGAALAKPLEVQIFVSTGLDFFSLVDFEF